MAVKLRLTRMGAKKAPFYRLVATDSRVARDGKAIEYLGTYNPMIDPAEVKLNTERVQYWLSVGAQMTDTAKELLTQQGIIERTPYRAPKPKQMPPAPKQKEEVVEGTTEENIEDKTETPAE